MKNFTLLFLALMICSASQSQNHNRVYITTVTPAVNTGMNYSPWLNDNLNDLIANVWSPTNGQYVDVSLALQTRTKVERLSFYDYEGVFTEHPAQIYAAIGNRRVFIGLFIGEAYLRFVDFNLSTPILADSIIVRKHGNSIPQKVRVYGQKVKKESVITFTTLINRVVGDTTFNLIASSTNNQMPITFTSSNPQIVSILNVNGVWKGRPVAPGVANIIASQGGNAEYDTAQELRQSQTITSTLTQDSGRIFISSIVPAVITGMNYSAWLDDNTNNLIQSVWSAANMRYVDVALALEAKSHITKVSLYDHQGIFPNLPVTVYAAEGTRRTLIGTFTGESYLSWVNLNLPIPVTADSIIIRKYGNNIPQKIKIFGIKVPAKKETIINFLSLTAKVVGDSPFDLVATSNNLLSPIVFKSSNPGVVSVSNISGRWKATIIAVGVATIFAIQQGNNEFLPGTANQQQVVTNALVLTRGKIPMEAKRWYQLNNTSNNLEKLFDGRTDEAHFPGWGLILSNFDAYYPLIAGEEMIIDSIRMFDGANSNADLPMTISIITDTWQRIPIATFTGTKYMEWVGPYPDRSTNTSSFKLDNPIKNARYLVINNNWNYPTELEFFGSYKSPLPQTTFTKSVKLKDVFGVNAFEWDFEEPNNPTVIDTSRMRAIKNFTGVRHYIDWEKLELQEGSYKYNPTYSGGWNYDAIYDSCKAAGIEVLACLKTTPGWMQNTYPATERDAENVPVRYGRDFTVPGSYIEQARVAFQYAARYGINKSVNPALLSVNSMPRWTDDQVNVVKIGLGLIKYIECDNERDKWWKGRKGYQTAREYAANLSAFYDGHKNTMGAGIGIKNADSSMKVVMGGIALASTDYVKGMIDWCKQYRGYKPDGSVNLCWDIINYHLYSNDAKSSQGGNATRGAAPEMAETGEVAEEFVKLAHEAANDMPVWVTECGYDVNQESPLKAIAIGNKTVLETQADWILRTALLYARKGIEKVFFYQLYDENINSDGQFGSMGLINSNRTRKPAADFMNQVNRNFGEYSYKQTLNADPIVDRYEYEGNSVYMLVMPTETNRTVAYTLDLRDTDSATIFSLAIGADKMRESRVAVPGGRLTINVSETPVFIKPIIKLTDAVSYRAQTTSTDEIKPLNIASVEEGLKTNDDFSPGLFPNPAVDFVNLTLSNSNMKDISVLILETGTGRTVKRFEYKKSQLSFSKQIDIKNLPGGFYSVLVKQGEKQKVINILKIFK